MKDETILGEAGTVLASPAQPEPDVTRLTTSASRPSDADATSLGPPPANAASADATIIGTPPPLAVDADATRIGPPDADPNATRIRPPESAAPKTGEHGLAVGEKFGRYTIVRMLGIGGMGAVYQAWDKELEVVVALKVIRPEVLRDPIAEQEIERRFKRELLLARQVTHKNVVRIYDLGEIDGIKYITMSYVDGKELAALLREEGRLPIETTLRIMRQVISGLVAAHKAGVIHRDLKPANIMIGQDGEALIMDFGIARSTGGAADATWGSTKIHLPPGTPKSSGIADSTMLGSVIGTVEYMAPEQARGQPVDHRADIFTAGLILYDVLAGQRREPTGGVVDQLKARMDGRVPPLKSIAPDVPDALAEVVTRAIEPDAAKRFQTTEEFAAALDRLDDHGVPKPIKRAVSLPVAAAGVLVLLGLSVGTWYYTRHNVPEGPHEPISVIIADFENRTGEPTFDRTLEPTLRRALEGAGFITAYDRVGIRRTFATVVPAKFDETATRELAVKQGLGVVLSGSIEKQGSGYRLAMKATQAIEGKLITDVSARASSAGEVIPAATTLVGYVREALGDQTSETDPFLKQRSLSTSSLEVLRYYAAAQNASADNKFEDARQNLLKAVQLDPNFGVGYLLLAGVARNLGKLQDAQQYVSQAMEHLDDMTPREKLTTRGMYFRLSSDYQQCVKESEDLVKDYVADVVGHNQLALCASKLRDFTRARDEMQVVVKILPQRAVFRDNLALYANYAGDFETGEIQARKAQELVPAGDAYAFLALGFSQMGQNLPDEALKTFAALAVVPGLGATFSASGLADLAAYEGRYADAIRIAEQGAVADLAAKNPDRAAAKLAEAAYAQLLRGQKAAAVAAAEKALATSSAMTIRFLAGRIFVEAGQVKKAAPLAAQLLKEAQPEPQAYGHLLESMMAVAAKEPAAALKHATEANALLDTWIGHFELGRAYLASKQYPQADSEFDRCMKRKGEALALFLDEEPTYAYFPMVYYYQGLVREGMKLSATESYRAYLAIREKAGEDPRIADLRRRVAK
jgi:eukaryotic-like serine/threonine-protein kinase